MLTDRELYMEHLKKVDDFLATQTKFINETLPEKIESEIKKAFTVSGIDTEKPFEMQELILWAKASKKRDDQIKTRLIGNGTTLAFNIVLALIMLGVLSFYTNHQINVAIRDNNPKIEKSEEPRK
jgi:hypothetical protein